MAEVYVESYDPLTGDQALEIADAYKAIGHES